MAVCDVTCHLSETHAGKSRGTKIWPQKHADTNDRGPGGVRGWEGAREDAGV